MGGTSIVCLCCSTCFESAAVAVAEAAAGIAVVDIALAVGSGSILRIPRLPHLKEHAVGGSGGY